MEKKYWFNPKINREVLRDSMQLDSGQTVATLETGKYLVTLEVRGEVRVKYNPDPNKSAGEGDTYKHASAFPDELLDIFAKGIDYTEMINIDVIYNNWFELFIFERPSKPNTQYEWTWTGMSNTCDPEDVKDETVQAVLSEYLSDYINGLH